MRSITFKDLKHISSAIQKKNENVLVDYLNSFDGSNTFEKFRNILIDWEQDISSSLNLNFNDKPTKIAISYILSQFPEKLDGKITIKKENVEIVLDIPKSFDTLVQETLPIYSLIQYINISGIFINLIDLSVQEKQTIIDNLPAKVYNTILKEILSNTSKILRFDNVVLDKFKFNFLTNEPYLFLKGLFTNFSEDYFKEVIFLLSKRIDGELLINSTPFEIEFYMEKYSEEIQAQNNGLTI